MRINPNTLAGKLTLLIAAIVALGIATSWLLLSYDMKKQIDDLVVTQLESDARVFARVLASKGSSMNDAELAEWSVLFETRLTVIGLDGRVLADSEIPRDRISELDNHLTRLEVRRAVESGSGVDRRYSESTKAPYLYFALKSDAGWGGRQGTIIRCSLPMSRFYAIMSRVRRIVLSALLISGAVGLVTGVCGVRSTTRPLRRLTEAARSGNRTPESVYPGDGSAEIEELSRALREDGEKVSKIMNELEHERRQLDSIVQSAPCGLMLIDRQGVIVAVNATFSALLREPYEKVVGTGVDGAIRAPELIELTLPARAGYGSSESARDYGERTFSCRHAGGERHYKARSVPAGNDILILLDDETDRKLDEEARKAFVADAGHELQTPLTSISVAAELLQGMADAPAEERMPYIEEIMRQRRRMSLLVDDLLLLSRLESGIPSAQSVPLDFSQVVREAAAESQSHSAAAQMTWDVGVEDGIFILGRREEIRRAVSNLLDNAVKYTRKRYTRESGGEIRVSLRQEGHSTLLTVSDNGIGIPQHAISRVFARFERVERDRARGTGECGGYGLGLAIVKRAVESHDGSVAVESGNGFTRFTVELPLAGE